jgi:hypothetical protein
MAVGLLYMQRPNLLDAGYSMLGAAALLVFVRYGAYEELESSLERAGLRGTALARTMRRLVPS